MWILHSAKLGRQVVAPLFDPVIFQLIEKLSDGNQRLREGAKKGLDVLAASSNIGPAVVGAHALRPLVGNNKTAWRPLSSRLQLLADLVVAYGVGGSTGLNPDSLLAFPKTNAAFEHSNGEVRAAAKTLVVAIQKVIGTPPLESVLASLRPKQREEYEAAFESAAGVAKKPAAGPVSSGYGAQADHKSGPGNKKGGPAADSKHDHHPPHKSPSVAHDSKVPTSDRKAINKKNDNSMEGGDDFTTCMFCGVSDKKWTENDLDVHYWKDCPLLISCPSCAQIVEIAGLPEHLLDECEAKDSYMPCDITGI
jgi:centrosomal protein CEP104